MMRKRNAHPTDGYNKTHDSNSTPTIGSGQRHTRLMHALGITSTNKSHNDSAMRTVTDAEAPNPGDFHRLETLESQKPDPRIWTTVERVNMDGMPASSSSDEVPLKPGMKKTTWNVRR